MPLPSGWRRFEHEDLDGDIGVDVVVAHKPITLRPVSCSISRLTSACMTRCQPSAQIQHGLALAGVGGRLLAAREAVLEHNEDAVVIERGPGLRRATAGLARERPHDRAGDRRRELPIGKSAVNAHLASPPARVTAAAIRPSLSGPYQAGVKPCTSPTIPRAGLLAADRSSRRAVSGCAACPQS
jgi:hypothetical protein